MAGSTASFSLVPSREGASSEVSSVVRWFDLPKLDSKCLLKWILPACILTLCGIICMWCLHIATFYYVQQMDSMEQSYIVNANASVHEYHLSPGLYPTNISFGSLEDPLEAALGWKSLPIAFLDMLAAILPASWFVLTILSGELQMWTHVIMCNCLLALGKGLFGVLTIVPDSIGWQECKARLGPESLEYLRSEGGKVFVNWDLLVTEFIGPKRNRLGSGMRFCADMVYSGHTYVTFLYALALIDIVRWYTYRSQWASSTRAFVVWMLVAFVALEQATEIYCVLLNRFHYTLDIVLAIVMTVLVYGNSTVAIAARNWSNGSERFTKTGHGEEGESLIGDTVEHIFSQIERAKDFRICLVPSGELRYEADAWVLPCAEQGMCGGLGLYHLIEHGRFWSCGETGEMFYGSRKSGRRATNDSALNRRRAGTELAQRTSSRDFVNVKI